MELLRLWNSFLRNNTKANQTAYRKLGGEWPSGLTRYIWNSEGSQLKSHWVFRRAFDPTSL